jgi:HPr kinase/phosphorylase
MAEKITIPLKSIIDEFALETVFMPKDPAEIEVSRAEVNRSGLQLAGFFVHFETDRIQLIGNAEYEYLNSLKSSERAYHIDNFMAHKPVAVILTHGLAMMDELKLAAERNLVPLLRTARATTQFVAALISSLSVSLAPRVTRHGVLVEVYGEGVLILGDSGVGKSETAIELVKRGHRLVADDAVEIKRVSDRTLVGTAPELIRHYVELRGIGIIDVRRIFGMGAVKMTEKIDLIINFEPWVQGKMYDRFGLDSETTDILGIEVPTLTIPVRPGRNLAIILEIAAMNNRQKKMGYNTAEEFNKRLMGELGDEDR